MSKHFSAAPWHVADLPSSKSGLVSQPSTASLKVFLLAVTDSLSGGILQREQRKQEVLAV